MTRREGARLAVALLLGAALAFPAGLIVAGLGSPAPAEHRPAAAAAGPMRNMFSPSIDGDPWFIERQREGIEALERHCRQTGESCHEAREARRWLEEQGG